MAKTKQNSSSISAPRVTGNATRSTRSTPSTSSSSKPLSSTSHTLQLLLLLTLQPILISICLFILPQGILHSLPSLPSLPRTLSPFSSAAPSSTSTSFGDNGTTIATPSSPIEGISRLLNGELGTLANKMWLALQGTALVQAWWTAAIKSWIDKDRMMRRGDREGLRRFGKRSRGEMLEQITLTAISLPFSILTLSAFILLFGSSWTTAFNQSLLLSVHLTLIAIFLPIHLYGLPSLPDWLDQATAVNPNQKHGRSRDGNGEGPADQAKTDQTEYQDQDGWMRVFARASPINATDAIPLLQVVGAVSGAWIGNAGMALDWERPWQQYPVPPIFGSLVGLTTANVIAFVSFVGGR